MGYTYRCDGCGDGYNTFPPFAGEFTEEFLNTSGGRFALDFNPGEKVTICKDCMDLLVLSGTIAVCRKCGTQHDIDDLTEYDPECAACDDGDLWLRERDTDD